MFHIVLERGGLRSNSKLAEESTGPIYFVGWEFWAMIKKIKERNEGNCKAF
jgi:hypothetical protein